MCDRDVTYLNHDSHAPGAQRTEIVKFHKSVDYFLHILLHRYSLYNPCVDSL